MKGKIPFFPPSIEDGPTFPQDRELWKDGVGGGF